MTFTEAMNRAAQVFEGVGAGVLAVGFVLSLVLAVRDWKRSGRAAEGYRAMKEVFGGALLLGLEILVAADLIRTVAVAPTFKNVAVLGLIVLIRTFLSFSLQIEIDGILPWRKALGSGGTGIGRAVRGAGQKPSRPPSGTDDSSP
ncbi:DUF1622 domain-containing protein [Streptomyces sp. NBC_01497]|uniref:DUF1622 domain-containing protein n=1 Tax=Streptomyces sp. NBC_01497 TaxID=2903885 RepID=UPI002E2FFDD2|nr:DUF1622 domain-containing protein [Streptomyces sp. NBC_01497]